MFFSIEGDNQSSNSKNYSNNNKNKQKLLLQDSFAASNRGNNPSLSTEFPDKHLSLQMETLPEGFAGSNLNGGGALTKKDFYNYQQCSRYELILVFIQFHVNSPHIELFCLNYILIF